MLSLIRHYRGMIRSARQRTLGPTHVKFTSSSRDELGLRRLRDVLRSRPLGGTKCRTTEITTPIEVRKSASGQVRQPTQRLLLPIWEWRTVMRTLLTLSRTFALYPFRIQPALRASVLVQKRCLGRRPTQGLAGIMLWSTIAWISRANANRSSPLPIAHLRRTLALVILSKRCATLNWRQEPCQR